MPYIKESNREYLDKYIKSVTDALKTKDSMSNEDIATILGDINYTFSRILGGIIDDVSYPKIAMITGVLENIKQEFYRRIAEPYEDVKIKQNGDIKEYKRSF